MALRRDMPVSLAMRLYEGLQRPVRTLPDGNSDAHDAYGSTPALINGMTSVANRSI